MIYELFVRPVIINEYQKFITKESNLLDSLSLSQISLRDSLILKLDKSILNNKPEEYFEIINKYFSSLHLNVDMDHVGNSFFGKNAGLPSIADVGLDKTLPPRPESFSPSLAKIIIRPLLTEEGESILEMKWLGSYASAECKKNKRVIYMPTNRTIYTEVYNYIFFREHEYGHHVLGHPSCNGKTSENPNYEFQADSFAVKSLFTHLSEPEANTICKLIYGGFIVYSSMVDMYENDKFEPRKPRLRDRAFAIFDQIGMPSLHKHPLAFENFEAIKDAYLNSDSVAEFEKKFEDIITGNEIDSFNQTAPD